MNNWFTEAIVKVIKEHIKECDYLNYKVKGFESIKKLDGNIQCHPNVHGGAILDRYEVSVRIVAKKYENNITKWQVNIYSNGDTAIYFNGEDYIA